MGLVDCSSFSRRRVRCSDCLDSSKIVGIGVLFRVWRWCTRGVVARTFGDVEFVDVDGCNGFSLFAVCTLGSGVGFTLGTDVLCTLGAGLFSLSSANLAASLKIDVSCRSASVCLGFRSIGAFVNFCIATMRSCAARRTVSPGSIAGILQCAGKNFAVPVMR